MKHLRLAAIIVAMIVVGGVVFFGTQYVADNYLDGRGSQATAEHSHETQTCKKTGQSHSVVIQGDTMIPQHTYAVLCDTLTVTNQDDIERDLAFGVHDHHQAYDGQTENMLKKGQSITVVLNQAGTFKFHDHLHDEVQGTFTVK